MIVGKCYALIWGIMHLWQYIHYTFFLLGIDHKPLKRFAIVLDAYGQRGRWKSMFQDFHFKIVDRIGAKHSNVDVLNRNLVGRYEVDEDFGNEIKTWVTLVKRFPIFRKQSSICLLLWKELREIIVKKS